MEPFINKKTFKKRAGGCHICGENDQSLLDVHRIIPGCDGGKYTTANSVCLCVKCHRLVTNGFIIVIGWKHSTMGRILHYFDENNKEHFK